MTGHSTSEVAGEVTTSTLIYKIDLIYFQKNKLEFHSTPGTSRRLAGLQAVI